MLSCPDPFFNNCKNSSFKCNICRAGNGKRGSNLFYKPIIVSPELITHPLTNKQPKNYAKSQQIKSALKTEQTIVDEIKTTLRSGAVLGDGDLTVNNLKLDSKVRFNMESFIVSPSEYRTAIQKGYDGWVITNKLKQRVVVLKEESFIKLVGTNLNQCI